MKQPKPTRRWTAGRIVRSAVRLALSLAIASVFVLPLVWVIGASLRQPGLPPPRTIEWLSAPAAFGNYREIFELVRLDRFLLNSLIIVAVAVPLTLVTSSWAGFAMAQLHASARRRFLILAVVLLMVPLTALWLPRFLLFNAVGLIDSLWALILPALMGSSPLFILLFYWTFRRVPVELFESARLDGAGILRIWASIAMPMARPTVVTVAVLAFAFYWSDFINPLLYIKSESRYPLPVGLQMLQQLDKTNWPLLMAAAAVMSVPMILTFLAVQKYFWPENRLGGISGH